MSGLLALLDDVAGIAKIAAASVDDITAHAAKAGSKAAGVVIDDAAVTPKYVTGFEPARELPIIWRIARGSLINKLVILLPIALLLSAFAPWLLPPLLVLGGAYLCYEGAEKAAHAFGVGADHGGPDGSHAVKDPGTLEEQKVKGAIKTDFILSAEIMTISLATIESDSIVLQAVILAVVGVAITAIVYGAVAIIVKMDDLGLWLGKNGTTSVGRSLGRGIVKVMPGFLKLLAFVGTVAMLWVGGSIILHSIGQMGWHGPEGWVHDIAYGASENGAVRWTITAAIDGAFGLVLGLLLVPVGAKLIAPAWGAIFKSDKSDTAA